METFFTLQGTDLHTYTFGPYTWASAFQGRLLNLGIATLLFADAPTTTTPTTPQSPHNRKRPLQRRGIGKSWLRNLYLIAAGLSNRVLM